MNLYTIKPSRLKDWKQLAVERDFTRLWWEIEKFRKAAFKTGGDSAV